MRKRLANPITYLDHEVGVLAQVLHLCQSNAAFVLVTSLNTKGGSARDLGSLAVANLS
jgi:xanthine dehydrogenase accessory factor